ncbi:MAG: hydrolase [Candidatus Gastranaerophilales bacterium]|nr:hydrolase [Candidatus Gastranaerophilales bacterium]
MSQKLNTEKSELLIIDVQEKLVAMLNKKVVDSKTAILAATANTLEIPTIITEQYPQGLGGTVDIVKTKLPPNSTILEKTTFSACETAPVMKTIEATNKSQIIICGIEAHICVLQTALDLINKGYEVFVVKDACASRNKEEFKLAIKRLEQAGAIITCVEMVLFELLGSAKHPKFKELQALIK